VRNKKKKYHCTENQNLNLNTERHRQTSLWIGFLIIRLFGNLKVIILFTGVIFPDYLIPKVISDYLSIAIREKLMITVAKHAIILVIIRSLATPYKLFKSFLKLPRCIFNTVAERKQSKAVISCEEWNWKSCSAALQFRTPFERFFSFLSHVNLRPFSFILNPKAVKCLHTFEIQNTANVVAMDETAIYDYSLVTICLNANIPTSSL
jgi:hypothetical protein